MSRYGRVHGAEVSRTDLWMELKVLMETMIACFLSKIWNLSLMISKSSAYRSHIRERQLRPRLLIVKDFMHAAAHPINVCLYGLQRP
jgi:hypothetical protein